MVFSLAACDNKPPAEVTTPSETTAPVIPDVTTPQETDPADTPVETTPVETPPVVTTPVETTPVVTTPVVTPEVTTPVVTTPVVTPEVTTPVVTTPVATPEVTTPVVTTPVVTPEVTTPVVTTPVVTPEVTTPVVTTPVETTPVETTPVETTPVETTPVITTPVETTPVETPVVTEPADTPEVTDPAEPTPKPAVEKILYNEGANGKLQLKDANATYVIYGLEYVPDANGKIDINPGWYGQPVTITRKASSPGVGDSSITFDIPAQPQTPPNVTGGYETIKGIDNSMEYKAFGTDKWVPVTSTVFAPGRYYVRFAATSEAFASKQTSSAIRVLQKTPEDTPNSDTVKIDYVNEKLVFTDKNAIYDIFGLEYTPDADGKVAIEPYWYMESQLLIIKKATSEEKSDSEKGAIVMPKRPNIPSGIKGGYEKITGITAAMEYSADNGVTWLPVTDVTDNTINVEPGTYIVRIAAVENVSFASQHTKNAITVFAKVAENTPTVKIDYANKTLIDFGEGSFTVNGAPVTLTNGVLPITEFGTEIRIVRVSRDNDQYKNSEEQVIAIPTLTAAPNPVGGIESISGLTNEMQYRLESSNEWTDVTAETVSVAPGTYFVRISAANGRFVSDEVMVTVSAAETTPEDTTAESTPAETTPEGTEPEETTPEVTTPVETTPAVTTPPSDGWTGFY